MDNRKDNNLFSSVGDAIQKISNFSCFENVDGDGDRRERERRERVAEQKYWLYLFWVFLTRRSLPLLALPHR